MRSKTLILLAGTTVVVAAVAAMTIHLRESAVEETPSGGKLFPDLAAEINDAASIAIRTKDGEYTIRRDGETWGLAEKSGYPVDMSAVRKCLIGIAELTTAEEKTSDPSLYPKLGVEDPATEGATSTLVTVRDGSGKELASLVVGKERTGKSFSGPKQLYVRKPDEARSWLANGEVHLNGKQEEWLERKILEVKRERVRSVEIRQADGETLLVDRDDPKTNDFTLHDVPEGKELTYPTAPNSLASALEWLNLEDVVPATEIDMGEGSDATTTFSCFDGLTITARTKTVGDKTYARFEASYVEPPADVGPPAPPADETAGDASDETSPEGKAAEKPAAPKSPEEVRKEVEELNARLSRWAFAIPSYNKTSFQKRKSELLKDVAPPPEASPQPAALEPPTETPAPESEPEPEEPPDGHEATHEHDEPEPGSPPQPTPPER